MPTQINPRSGPFPVYGSASPPTIDVGIFTIAKTGVNLKASGTTVIFAVPTGRTYLAFGAYILVTAVTSGGAGVQIFSLTESAGSAVMVPSIQSASGTPVVGTTFISEFRGNVWPGKVCAAGANVQIVVGTSHAGSSAVTGTVFAIGIYSS